jgi:hypothetical protein
MDTFCTVTTLRASLNQTLQFVRYHLSAGAEQVILYFDNPTDPAIDVLSGADRVTVIPCDERHWETAGLSGDCSLEDRQVYNATQGFRQARSRGYDWVVHIDSDELLYAEEGLRKALTSVAASQRVVRFQTLEAVPSRHDHVCPFEEINMFRVNKGQRYKRLANRLGCQGAFYHGEYFRGHTAGKAATRTSADVSVLHIHEPIMDDGTRSAFIPVENGYVLHYDCCGVKAFRSKWSRRFDGTETVARLRENRKRQGKAVERHVHDDKRLTRLFEELYFLSSYEQLVLRLLGLVRRVRVKVPGR